MKKVLSLTRCLTTFGELGWCVMCASVVLLGNGWNVLIGVPAQVTLGYAAVSSAFATVAIVTAMCRQTLQTLAKR